MSSYTTKNSSVLTILPIRGTVKSELKAANQQQALGIAILLLVLIISPIIIFLVRYRVSKISPLEDKLSGVATLLIKRTELWQQMN